MVGRKDKGAFLSGRGPINTVGEATARMGEGSGPDEERIRAGSQFQFMVGLNFMECDLGAELGESGGKERFALLGVEGAFDQVSGVGTRKARGIDGDIDSFMKRGSKKGKALQVIPMGVGEQKSKGTATFLGPIQSGLAQARTRIDDEKVVFAPGETEAGGVPAKFMGWNCGSGWGRDASSGTPEV